MVLVICLSLRGHSRNRVLGLVLMALIRLYATILCYAHIHRWRSALQDSAYQPVGMCVTLNYPNKSTESQKVIRQDSF